MTDTRPALAHGEPIIVVAPEGVDRAISKVMGRHRAELDEALQPFGVALDDLVQATWMRFVRFGDVVPLDGGGKLLIPDDDRPAGGCCGPGEACSSPACTGAPVDDGEACDPAACSGGCSRSAAAPAVDGVYVTDQLRDVESFGEAFPEPRSDAAVFGAPAARFGRGGVRGDDE